MITSKLVFQGVWTLSLMACIAGCGEPTTKTDLMSMVPANEVVSVGLAGERPADISRYLLARGGSEPRLSPDGRQVVFRSSVTGISQLWTLP